MDEKFEDAVDGEDVFEDAREEFEGGRPRGIVSKFPWNRHVSNMVIGQQGSLHT